MDKALNSNYTAVTNALKPSCSNNQNNETPGTVLEFFFIFLHKNAQNVTVDLLHMGFAGALGAAPCKKKRKKKNRQDDMQINTK